MRDRIGEEIPGQFYLTARTFIRLSAVFLNVGLPAGREAHWHAVAPTAEGFGVAVV